MRTLRYLPLLGLMWGLTTVAADKVDLKDIKCPVSGRPAIEEQAEKYKEGHVYFCCPNCPKAFKENTEKFSTKANHQLAATGQYVAKACPLSGQKIAVKVGDSPEIGFCCEKCEAKYKGASDEEKLTLVFADAAFKKGFEPKKEEKKSE